MYTILTVVLCTVVDNGVEARYDNEQSREPFVYHLPSRSVGQRPVDCFYVLREYLSTRDLHL